MAVAGTVLASSLTAFVGSRSRVSTENNPDVETERMKLVGEEDGGYQTMG